MLEITFEINGKKVDPDDIADELQRTVLKKIEESLDEDLGESFCPEHGAAPSVLCNGDGLNNLSFQVWACCDNFAKHAASQIYDGLYERDYKISIEIDGAEAHKFRDRFFCPACKYETVHMLRYAHTRKLSLESDGLPYRFFWDVWLIWKCNHCAHLLLEDTYKAHEWFEGKPWDGDYDYATYYPDTQQKHDRFVTISDNLTPKSFSHVPRKIQRVYGEVIQTYNNHIEILCTIGIRSLIEELSKDKRVPKAKELWERIRNLTSLGIPTEVTENLQGVKELGNKATHELKPAKRKDLRVAIELVEDILHFVYELEPRTKKLKRHRKNHTQKAKPDEQTKTP